MFNLKDIIRTPLLKGEFQLVNMIVATDHRGLIGNKGELPWGRLPTDLKFFREKTEGHIVVMGRKTFESIGRPLPNRENIVLTRNPIAFGDRTDITVLPDIEAVMTYTRGKEIFIIGGGEIYKAFLPLTQVLYRTTVNGIFKGDTYFPELDEGLWFPEHLSFSIKDNKNSYECFYQKLTKIV